jgi:hypothetical protein
VVHPEERLDGIKPDGSFQQHIGIIYDGERASLFLFGATQHVFSGNYGKD